MWNRLYETTLHLTLLGYKNIEILLIIRFWLYGKKWESCLAHIAVQGPKSEIQILPLYASAMAAVIVKFIFISYPALYQRKVTTM